MSAYGIPAISQKVTQVPRSAEFKFSWNGQTGDSLTPNKREKRRVTCAIILSFFGQFMTILRLELKFEKPRELTLANNFIFPPPLEA